MSHILIADILGPRRPKYSILLSNVSERLKFVSKKIFDETKLNSNVKIFTVFEAADLAFASL